MSVEAKLEEAVLAYLFGADEGDEDPGAIVSEGVRTPGFEAWLRGLAADLPALKAAVGADANASVARARLAALQHEIAARLSQGGHAGGASAAEGAVVIALDARRREKRRTYAFVGTFAALAAGILVAVVAFQSAPGAPAAPRPTVAQAKHWVEALDAGGQAFAGAGPSAHDRGFLVGLVRDLSAPHPDGSAPGAEELETARIIAQQAAAGLGHGDRAEAVRVKALGGCKALLEAVPAEVSECERGLADYITHRDAALATPP